MTGSVLGQYRLKPAAVEDLRFNSSHTSQYFSICRRAGRHSFSRAYYVET